MAEQVEESGQAPAYVYLATHDSSYVTGAVTDLTGGQMLP